MKDYKFHTNRTYVKKQELIELAELIANDNFLPQPYAEVMKGIAEFSC